MDKASNAIIRKAIKDLKDIVDYDDTLSDDDVEDLEFIIDQLDKVRD